MPLPPAPEPSDLQSLVGSKLGNYRLERIVGRGRMGVVYLATDEALLRRTAVKVLSWSMEENHGQDPVQWFLAEARLVARINHPLVVQIYAVARHGDHRYIAMEFIDGPSAEGLVFRDGPLEPGRATDVLAQIASALHGAHQAGVIHRDVKPANLLVAVDGTAKLTDFGMALEHSSDAPPGPSLRVGTPYYTAPEIWMGAPANPATDIYALGATYFHLLTGKPPYTGKDIPTVQDAHLRLPVPDPRDRAPSVPPACALLARRMLAKKPKDRYESAEVIAREAHRTLDALGSNTRGARERRRPSPPFSPLQAPRAPAATRTPLSPAPRPAASPPPMPEHSELFGPLPATPAGEPLSSALGFLRRPFAPVESERCPYQGEPYPAFIDKLLGPLGTGVGTVVAVYGPSGSGRSTLCRRAAGRLRRIRPVIGFDMGKLAEPTRLLLRLRNAASEPVVWAPTGQGAEIDAQLESLSRARLAGHAPVVVLDGVGAPLVSDEEIARLVGSAAWSGAFSTVLVGPPGLVQRLAGAGLRRAGLLDLPVPPLDTRQVGDYVQSWIRSARPPNAPAVLFSPDAMLLLAHRTSGNLEAINCLAENMLLLAAAHVRRLVTSWDAWAAPVDERWWGKAAPADLPRRPAQWPSREASQLIDTCRAAAGLPRTTRAFNTKL